LLQRVVAENVLRDPLCGCWKISPGKKRQSQGHEKQQVSYAKLFGGFMVHAETRLFLGAFSFPTLGLAVAVDKVVCQRGNIPAALGETQVWNVF
jgi:hypothetical protein